MWGSAVQVCSGLHGGIAQLARAPALQAGGRRFDSVYLHHHSGSHIKVAAFLFFLNKKEVLIVNLGYKHNPAVFPISAANVCFFVLLQS